MSASASGSQNRVRFDLEDGILMSNDDATSTGSVEMDRDVAQRLFEVGASIVLLDVPGEPSHFNTEV